MTTMRRVVVVGIAGVACLGLVACGDDDDALSEEEFLEQGNEICAEGSEALDALAERVFEEDEEPTPDQVSEFADEFEDNIDEQIDDLADLNPPEELADDVDAVLEDARGVLDEFVQDLREDPEAVFSAEEDPFADINAQLEEIGLTECAE
jgi:hypothetical protein